MKKSMLLTAFTLSMTFLLVHNPLMAGEAKQLSMPSQEIVIDGKKPAKFDHTKHADLGLSCGACHHNSEHQALTAADITAKTETAQLQCISCHNNEFPVKKLQNLKDIFHTRCKDCHSKGLDGKKGPTSCNDCHIKAKKSAKKIEGC